MPFVQRFLFAIRTLLEDEQSPPTRRKKRVRNGTPGTASCTRQTVALVVTFRDLFASGNLNLILEDIESNRRSLKRDRTPSRNRQFIGPPSASSTPLGKRNVSGTPNQDTSLVPTSSTVWPLVLDGIEETVPLLREEKIISCPRIDFRDVDKLVVQKLSHDVESRQLVPFEKGNLNQQMTVSLSADDEKRTAAILRKVLKWSPRKQSAVSFAVPLPKKEEHKAVAVVQNAVNRVKEENLGKKKKKWKCLKFTFC